MDNEMALNLAYLKEMLARRLNYDLRLAVWMSQRWIENSDKGENRRMLCLRAIGWIITVLAFDKALSHREVYYGTGFGLAFDKGLSHDWSITVLAFDKRLSHGPEYNSTCFQQAIEL